MTEYGEWTKELVSGELLAREVERVRTEVGGGPLPIERYRHALRLAARVAGLSWGLEVAKGIVQALGRVAPFHPAGAASVGIVLGDSLLGVLAAYPDLAPVQRFWIYLAYKSVSFPAPLGLHERRFVEQHGIEDALEELFPEFTALRPRRSR